MALNIRDPEVHSLARALADATGQTMTNAIKDALRDRLAAVVNAEKEDREARFAAIMDRGRRFRALPTADSRPLHDIVEYDDDGLPR
jgi:antitoxin VapB